MTTLLNFQTTKLLDVPAGPRFNAQVGGGTQLIESNDVNHWKKAQLLLLALMLLHFINSSITQSVS